MTDINFNFQEARKIYVEEMTKFREESGYGPFKFTPEQAVENMLQTIYKGTGREDWLKYNPAMKKAAKRIGITKSSAFREWVKKNYVPVVVTSG